MQTLERNLLDELGSWPEKLLILRTDTGLYANYCFEGVHGMMSFESQNMAKLWANGFAASLKLRIDIIEVSFDEARRLAKERPMPVVALFLADDIENPLIHFVR